MKKHNIYVHGKMITVTLSKIDEDYISLTDIARFKNESRTNYIIQNWMRTKSTLYFLGIWEKVNNPNFKGIEFDAFKKDIGRNNFSLTPIKWIKNVDAIGIISKSGRYGGGVFAHKDIAFEFASWISPEFKLYLIKEFQRLKMQEQHKSHLEWDAKRMLTKINYRIHTDAIQEHIVIPQKLTPLEANLIYAYEADVLNMALFGKTAKDWKEENPNTEGNIRDHADVYQLVCLSNLESINALYITQNLSQSKRLLLLNKTAITQMKSLHKTTYLEKLL